MVLAAGDLHDLVGAEEPPDLLQRLGWHDQVGLRRSAGLDGRHIHPGQPVAVGGHHAHPLGPELPQHPVEDGAAFLGARGKGDVADELLELPGGGAPATFELYAGKCGKLFPRQAEQLESGAAAFDRHPLLSGRRQADGGAGQLPHDLDQLARRQRDGAFLIDRCRDGGADRDVQIGA